MKIKKITFSNFRLFEELEIKMPESNFLVLIGGNGSGKTTILDGIALALNHFTGELLSSKEGYNIDAWFINDDITSDKNEGKVYIEFEYFEDNNVVDKNINLSKSIEVIKNKNEAGLKFDKQPTDFILSIKEQLRNDTLKSIPIIAYYNVQRTSTSKESNRLINTYNEKLFAYVKTLNLSESIFQEFEQWYLKQEIIENANKVQKADLKLELPSLKNVRSALSTFISAIDENSYGPIQILRETIRDASFVEYTKEFLSVEKNNKQLKFNQLSSGEKMFILLVVDIARRLTIANENSTEALNGEGVVLIDELELHIHPNWQLKIVKALKTTFPNLQFIATTHSPLVLSGIRREDIIVLTNGTVIPNEELSNIYSSTADQILEEIMFADNKIDEFSKDKNEIDILFSKKEFTQAEDKLNKLKQIVKSSPKWLVDYERRISFAKS